MMSESLSERGYFVHGTRVRVSGNGTAPQLLDRRLVPFRSERPGSAELAVRFHCIREGELHSIDAPVGAFRRIYEPPRGEVLYYQEDDQVFINYEERVRALCHPASGRISFSLIASEENAWLASHPLFTICWIEMLKRIRLYSVHASGVCCAGKGLLLAGPSGSGKTTLALALLKAGFGFLGDDMLFLRSDPDGLRVLAFPDETDVTEETIEWFPELRSAGRPNGISGRQKDAVRAEAIYQVPVALECEPLVVVFPRVVRGQPCALRVIDAGEALLELSSNVLLTERQASQAHLEVLGCLIRRAQCYRLDTARPDEAAAMLGELVPR